MPLPSRVLTITAALFAAAAAPPPAVAQNKVPDSIEQRMKACAICHGEKGEGLQSKNEYFPRLAGKPEGYLYNQLINFRDKRREYAIMNYMVAFLSDGYLSEIASYYAALQPPYPAPSTRAPADEIALGGKLVREGDASRQLPSCVSCHGSTLTGVEPAIPGLVGLYPPYVSAQLGAWKDNKRHAMKPDCMHEMAVKLTPKDIAAVTAWLVAQPVPADPRPAKAETLPKLPLECGGLNTKGTR
jgi:cytochrome c553